MSDANFSKRQLSKIKEYIKKAQSSLRSCYNCQPAGRDDDDIWIGGVQTDLYDFILYDLEAPEKYLIEIAEFLVCPNCGTELDERAEVGVASIEDNIATSLWKKWVNKYQAQYLDFHRYLEQYPYLGLNHKFGKELYKGISEFPKIVINGRVGFRARGKGSIVKTSNHMFPPPTGKEIPEGRFNHFGQRVFYLANSIEGAASEVLENEGEVWVQKFQINNATDILDLTIKSFDRLHRENNLLNFGLLFGEMLSQKIERKPGWKPEYFITRFISDCAKNVGFKGIKFESSRINKNNLILFDWNETEIKAIGNPFSFTLKNISPWSKSMTLRDEFLFPAPENLINYQLELFDEKHGIINSVSPSLFTVEE